MDITILDKGIEELKILKESVSKLENLSVSIKKLSSETKSLNKQITSGENQLTSEIDKSIREKRSAVESKYDKQISSLIAKKNKTQSKRSKTRKEAVSDRIKSETNEPEIERRNIKKERRVLSNQSNIPLVARTRFFSALYLPKGFKDFLIIVAVLLVVLFIIPCGIFFLWLSDRSYIYLALLYIVSILVFGGAYLAFNKVKANNMAGLTKLRDFRIELDKNRSKLKKIKKGIIKDTDDSGYGLHEFDSDIKAINQEIDNFKSEKAKALNEFEANTKDTIINDISNTRQPAIDDMKDLLKKKSEKLKMAEASYSKLSLDISNNYEVFIGKDFMNSDKLDHLETTMKSNSFSTIREAIAYLKENKK